MAHIAMELSKRFVDTKENEKNGTTRSRPAEKIGFAVSIEELLTAKDPTLPRKHPAWRALPPHISRPEAYGILARELQKPDT